MLNFGLTDLRLVAPRDGWPNPDAGPAASGADSVLADARLFDDAPAAVADCAYVYAATVRKRGLSIPALTFAEAAAEIAARPGKAAILFGGERSGLETGEAALAQAIVTVPVNPEFRSINLAQAVILFAYEMSRFAELAMPTLASEEEERATHDQYEGLIGQVEASLSAADYYHPPDRTEVTKLTLRNILTKPDWSNREIQALRGVMRALAEPRRGRPPRD